MKQILFIDFETAYCKKTKYDLRHMSILEYVRDSRFKAFGAGVCELNGPTRWIPAAELPAFFAAMEEKVGWENIAVVGHNVKFDGFILSQRYGIKPGQWIDTKGMSKAVLGKTVKGHSLQLLSEHFELSYGGRIGKGAMETDGKWELTPQEEAALADYCLGDVDLDRQLFKKLEPDFPASQYPVLDLTIDMFVDPKMELDVPLLEETAKMEAERRAKIFDEIGIEKSVFASNVKFPALLESKGYTVPLKKSPKKKNPDGSAMMIPALALGDTEFLDLMETENEDLKDLCEARVAAKSTLLQTRSTKLARIGATGDWSFDVEFSGADQTQRFSGGNGAGGNPQNFTNPAKIRDPKKKKMASALRKSVKAPRGFELVVGDFSQVEFRIVAYLSKDPGLIQSIEQHSDIYCDFASVFYGRRITKKDEKERNFGKQAILGLGYGMGWEKFQRTVYVQTGEWITEEEARRAVDLYRNRYSGVKALWAALDNTIQLMATPDSTRKFTDIPVRFGFECVTLPSGLKIKFPNLRQRPSQKFKGQMEWVYDAYNKGHVETRTLYGGKLLENISQSIAGEFCKEVMARMNSNPITKKAVTGQVHDELHYRARKGLGLVVARKLKREMSTSPKWFPNIILDAEVHVGTNWGDAK